MNQPMARSSNMGDDIQYPKIGRCKNGEKKSKDGLNFCGETTGFITTPMYNQNAEIVEFEVECPWCGALWWIPVSRRRQQLRLYKKRRRLEED